MANVAKLLMIQGGKCFYCGNKLAMDDATIDHVIPKALGGDNSEGNTVACCHSVNQAFGNATPKEKLTALINAGGLIECPTRSPKQVIAPPPVTIPTATATTRPIEVPVVPLEPPKQKAAVSKPTPAKKPSELQKPLRESFQAASTAHGGQKALLSAVGVELRKRILGFAVKNYGEKTFAKLVAILGYRVDKTWCYTDKGAASK
jgi:hypothetical protein